MDGWNGFVVTKCWASLSASFLAGSVSPCHRWLNKQRVIWSSSLTVKWGPKKKGERKTVEQIGTGWMDSMWFSEGSHDQLLVTTWCHFYGPEGLFNCPCIWQTSRLCLHPFLSLSTGLCLQRGYEYIMLNVTWCGSSYNQAWAVRASKLWHTGFVSFGMKTVLEILDDNQAESMGYISEAEPPLLFCFPEQLTSRFIKLKRNGFIKQFSWVNLYFISPFRGICLLYLTHPTIIENWTATLQRPETGYSFRSIVVRCMSLVCGRKPLWGERANSTRKRSQSAMVGFTQRWPLSHCGACPACWTQTVKHCGCVHSGNRNAENKLVYEGWNW